MSAELLVNVTPFETRIARVENGQAEEVYIERERERGLKGNIYSGRVQRVLPGIQAAFVDIGLPRAGFLYAGDIVTPAENMDEAPADAIDSQELITEEGGEEPEARAGPDISSLLSENQQITVQVSKDPISSKGPRLTTLISLAGR